MLSLLGASTKAGPGRGCLLGWGSSNWSKNIIFPVHKSLSPCHLRSDNNRNLKYSSCLLPHPALQGSQENKRTGWPTPSVRIYHKNKMKHFLVFTKYFTILMRPS